MPAAAVTCPGVLSDRVTQYNYNINLEMALAADKKAGGSMAAGVQRYRDFRDLPLGLKVNDLCLSIGMDPIIPCLDVASLEVGTAVKGRWCCTVWEKVR